MPEKNTFHYRHAPIPGEDPSVILPDGCALVLEGGGLRGFYSAGVFEAFMDAGLMFSYIVGVSAGAANALTYVAGQKLRNRQILERYVNDSRYVGMRNFLRTGTLFGYDFIFDTIPNQYVFWDREHFERSPVRFLTGATDCVGGETVWFEKGRIDEKFTVCRASCSVPIVSRVVSYEGMELLDGGVRSPIPIEKSIEDGNTFHVVVLTQNPGYKKRPFPSRALLRAACGRCPKLVEVMECRHAIYNRELALCERLESEGKALIIRPLEPLKVSRTGRNREKLLALYDEGHREGSGAVAWLRKRFDGLERSKE